MSALIMIVDDEHAIVETLTEVLTWEGYEVVSAPNGKVALELMAKQPPSLVLLDNMMPVLDGRQTLATMRGERALAEIPVIMMSAMPKPSSTDAPPWNHYLRKPFRAPALLAAIAECLANPRRQADQ